MQGQSKDKQAKLRSSTARQRKALTSKGIVKHSLAKAQRRIAELRKNGAVKYQPRKIKKIIKRRQQR